MHVEALQTLGDPTRLQIVEILRGGELSVNEIVENFDIDQSGISRQSRVPNCHGRRVPRKLSTR